MKLKRLHVGEIEIRGRDVDVTDPGYDKDVWCRTTIRDVVPGTYNCYAYAGKDPDWGERIWISQIVCADLDLEAIAEERIAEDEWEFVGEIGVDAGLAGFFEDKPDFGDNEWSELCDWMFANQDDSPMQRCYIKSFASGDGFWTESGCGDGCYDVYVIREKDKVIAIEIRF